MLQLENIDSYTHLIIQSVAHVRRGKQKKDISHYGFLG